MLESHHLISSLISPVTISRFCYWPRVQLSFEHLGLSCHKLFFFSKTGNVSAIAWWNAYPVLISQADIHVRFSWTSFDDRAHPNIKAKHVHRWPLANSFRSSAYHTPLAIYPILSKPKKTSSLLQQVRFHQWNIVTRRVETDNIELLQARDVSSFHDLMLLVFRFELIKNVLEFLFQYFVASLGTCASFCKGCSELSSLFC